MKWLARALVVVLPLLSAPAVAEESACVVWDPTHPELFVADPTTLAEAWLPNIERLYEAIPFLLPSEEQWLEEELKSLRRAVRAMNSREFALREAKLRVGGELGLVRRLTEERDRAALARNLLWFAYALIDTDTALYIARLEAEGVIQREAIPFNWKWYAEGKGGATLHEAVRWGRAQLARHVLSCTLPSVLGVSMEPAPWRTNPATDP